MKKALIATRGENILVNKLRDDRSLRPDLRGEIHPSLRGEIHSGLWGNLTGLRGDLTGLWGDLSFLRGDLTDCELSEKERAEGVDIRTLAI